MNQIKIGKFIAEARKKQNMTQKELATILKVTDRAISNWENGKNMPDISLFKPLCKSLNITINDLLSGEKINKQNYHHTFEENVVEMINYSHQNTFPKKILLTIIIIIILILTLLTYKIINYSNIKKSFLLSQATTNKLDTKELELENNIIRDIKSYLLNNMPKTFTDINNQTFNLTNIVKIHILSIDEISDDEIYVYAWAMTGSHYIENIEDEKYINFTNCFSKPYKFILKRTNIGIYEVLNEFSPEGNYENEFYYKIKPFLDEYYPKEVEEIFNEFFHNKGPLLVRYGYQDILHNILF